MMEVGISVGVHPGTRLTRGATSHENGAPHARRRCGCAVDLGAITDVKALGGTHSEVLEGKEKPAGMGLEGADLRSLRGEHDIEQTTQSKGLELCFGGIVREDSEAEPAALARVQELEETRLDAAREMSEGLVLHPAGHAGDDDMPFHLCPLTSELYLCLGDVAGTGGRRTEVLLGLAVGDEDPRGLQASRGIGDMCAEETHEHGTPKRALTIEGAVHVENDRLQGYHSEVSLSC